MKPDDWTRAMENEASSVEDAAWARETRRAVWLRQIGRTALVSLLVFQFMALVPAGLYLAGVPDNLLVPLLNTLENVLMAGLCFWLGRRGWVLWPMIAVGLLAPFLTSTWPAVALGWISWHDALGQHWQMAYSRERLLWLPVQLILVFAIYFTGQRWLRRKPQLSQ
ncbi:hypothetical protein [Deinococcus sp.]|uniref:hypothetical protein n=1 Tax=Deinococcus sp. TaxID=47478 RepID=UPI003B5B416D